MCLKPQSPQPIPPDTKALVGPLLDEDTVYRFVGDVLFAQFRDEDFADLYPNDGQPALSPVLLSFVLIFQALENLSDRATAFAVAFNVAWKYALHLPLAYPGFDPTVLSEFRQRLLTHNAEARLFTAVFAQLKQLGFFKRKGIQHTDSIVVLTHHRLLHRIELCVETMRTTIKSLLHHDPEWTRATLPAEWEARYAKRCKAERLSEQERQTLSGVVGDDGQWLLERLGQDDAAHLCELCAVSTLRDVWAVHYERCADGHTRWREGDALGSVRRTVSDAGVPLGVVQYDPWGSVESGSVPTFGFTGELQQGGDVYLRARWYTSAQGKFTTVDPAAGAAETPYSLHPYLWL